MTHIHDNQLQDYAFSGPHHLSPMEQEHLLTCGACQARIETYQLMKFQLSQMESPVIQANVYPSIRNKLKTPVNTNHKLPWHIPLLAFSIGIILFFLPKIQFGYELPIQFALGISLIVVLIFLEIKHLEWVYKQKINQVL